MSQSISGYKTTYECIKNPVTRVKEIDFGMGYRNIITDGLNSDTETWSIYFIPMDTTSVVALETILLNSVNGSSNFIEWTPNGESEVKYFTAKEIQKHSVGPGLFKINCTFRREFPL